MKQDLKIEYIPIEDIKPYGNNVKKHSESQIEYLANSIKLTKGLKQPIVIDKNNVIVCGHGRLLAVKKLIEQGTELKLDIVPCVLADDLTDDEIKAYRLADNKTASSEYDIEIELAELDGIAEIDMSDFGFDLDGGFDMENIEEVSGFDENNDNREYFTAAFTFPTAQKEQILKYLRKHKAEITEDIIQKARNE